jgi:hypothetical protein
MRFFSNAEVERSDFDYARYTSNAMPLNLALTDEPRNAAAHTSARWSTALKSVQKDKYG